MTYVHEPCGASTPTILLAFIHLQTCPKGALLLGTSRRRAAASRNGSAK